MEAIEDIPREQVEISLRGLAEEWEQIPKIRGQYRQARRLFKCKQSGYEPKCHVEEAAANELVLRCLAKRMADHKNEFDLECLPIPKIPALEAEPHALKYSVAVA